MVKMAARTLEQACAYVAGILFMLILAVNIAEVGERYLFARSLIWSSDLSRMMFIWMVMLGAAAAFPRGEHLAVTFIKQMLPRRAQRAVDLVTRLLFGLMLFILVRDGAVIAAVRMNINYVQLGWPSGLAYYAVPFSAAVMLFFLAISLWDTLMVKKQR